MHLFFWGGEGGGGDAVVGTGNAGWTIQRVDIPAHVRTAHNGLHQKPTGRGSLLNRPYAL